MSQLIASVLAVVERGAGKAVRHAINCGRTSLTFMASWEVATPSRLPFTPAELAARATLEPVPLFTPRVSDC